MEEDTLHHTFTYIHKIPIIQVSWKLKFKLSNKVYFPLWEKEVYKHQLDKAASV